MAPCAPRVLSAHAVAHLAVTRFLDRFGAVCWIVDDTRRAAEDPAGLGVTVFQGPLAELRGRLPGLLGLAPAAVLDA